MNLVATRLAAALTVLLVLCLWHVAVLVSGVRPYLLPSPSTCWRLWDAKGTPW